MRRNVRQKPLACEVICLLTVNEAAEISRVTPKTVRRWLNDSERPLRGVKLNGRSWRIAEADLLEYLGLSPVI
ncbi:MAG: helix-turn-helix domain-containing protein [Bacilli bacterium]|jgi:excisionase family DNA binding protein